MNNNKIIIGASFYGILQTRDNINSSWKYSSNLSYNVIVSDYLNNNSYIYNYDNIANAPYLISNDALTFISYDDEVSIAAKCNFVNVNGLAGVFSWHSGLDYNDVLLSSMYNGLK